MPSSEETPKDIDMALQILDAVNSRVSTNGDIDSTVAREITQTDHLNKRLLKTFLERLNLMSEVPVDVNEEDDNTQNFDD